MDGPSERRGQASGRRREASRAACPLRASRDPNRGLSLYPPLGTPPPAPPRASPYRSIFLYRLLRGICNVRAVSDTFQSCSCSFRNKKARSAACLNSSNVPARNQVASPPLTPAVTFPLPPSPFPTSRSTSL